MIPLKLDDDLKIADIDDDELREYLTNHTYLDCKDLVSTNIYLLLPILRALCSHVQLFSEPYENKTFGCYARRDRSKRESD